MHASLPVPEPGALAASHALQARIEAEIAVRGGWIGFADYMQLALYTPGLGYYTGGAAKFGPAGDFITAPSLGPLFAQTLARQVAEVIGRSAPNILEFGAGGGELAGGLLAELAALGCAVESYAILEPGAELATRQRAAIARLASASTAKVEWLDALPARLSGVMIANEVVDAMPVHALAWREEGVFERGVSSVDGRLQWDERPATGEVLAAARALPIAPPYASEIGLAAQAWMATVGPRIDTGALLVMDYGFPAREFYHPQRSGGTLMAHYRHHAHADPFFHPGLQDITAHVDFSALAASARAAGLEVLGYATQANFLVNCGITEVLDRTDAADVRRYAPLASAAQKLLSPAEMGELFKVLCVGRGIGGNLMGFARGERSHTL
ncbi:MAG: SAM-dependent methyltransferase [Betaproteobacteria bacterium]